MFGVVGGLCLVVAVMVAMRRWRSGSFSEIKRSNSEFMIDTIYLRTAQDGSFMFNTDEVGLEAVSDIRFGRL